MDEKGARQMNANELADKLEQGHWEGGTREQAATMLRQQQAEIEALKSDGKVCARCGAIAYDPVITQTAKTLTDEEDTECQYCKQGCIRCDARKLLTDDEIIEIWCGMETDTGEQNIAFARAILRKAQEK